MKSVDLVRLVALGEGVVSLVLSGMTLHYFTKRGPAGPVGSHVWRVTLTYVAFVIFGLAEIVTHWGADWRWQLVALMTVFLLAANSLIPLLSYERAAARKTALGRRLGD